MKEIALAKHRRASSSPIIAFVALARPKQWIKNGLLFAAPTAAGKLFAGNNFLLALAGAILFSVAASGLYMINDARDFENDRLHPTKKNRPIASGLIEPRAAVVVGSVLIAVAGVLGFTLSIKFALVLIAYLVTTVAYTYYLKNEPVIDIAIVSFGFLLRSIAGGLATSLPLSVWFLTVAAFGSLFMVTGKRYAEVLEVGENAKAHKSVLGVYSAPYLNYVRSLASAVSITAYGLWTFEGFAIRKGVIFVQLSAIPFVVGILIYALEADKGRAGSPEEVVLSNRRLQLVGALWLVLVATGVYYSHFFK
jgi:decaprenyl-phosphate phosphoribosyltransferase